MYSDRLPDPATLRLVGGRFVLKMSPDSALSWFLDYVGMTGPVDPWRVLAPDNEGEQHETIARFARYRDALAAAKRCVRADVRQFEGTLCDPDHERLL